MECNLSQNDYPIQELNGLFHIPKYSSRVLASCTTSVYVNLSKNSFLRYHPNFCAKADAKVRIISIQTKLFLKKNPKNTKVFGIVYKIRLHLIYYI